MVKSLLIDDAAEDPRWVIDWVCGHLSDEECEVLTNLEKRFDAVAAEAD